MKESGHSQEAAHLTSTQCALQAAIGLPVKVRSR